MTEKLINMRASEARWIMIFSYLFCLVVDSTVLLDSSMAFIPPMTLMTVLYWCGHFLDKTHLTTAFILGLLADALYQTTLGAHALLYIIIVFMMIRHRLQFRAYPVWQQAFFIGAYLMAYQALNALFFSPVLDDGSFVPFWSMPAIAILIWPPMATLLNRLTQRAHSD